MRATYRDGNDLPELARQLERELNAANAAIRAYNALKRLNDLDEYLNARYILIVTHRDAIEAAKGTV